MTATAAGFQCGTGSYCWFNAIARGFFKDDPTPGYHDTLKDARDCQTRARNFGWEGRSEQSARAFVHPAKLTRGTRYQWSRGSRISSGVFLRYEIVGDDPVAIFRDFSPRTYMDWTETTQIVIGLAWLIDSIIEEVA